MTSLTIPRSWLNARKFSNEWIFECSTDLPDLVKSDRAASYFRQLINLLEIDNQILDYHLELRHNVKRNYQLDIFIYFGNLDRNVNPSPTSVCISCEPTHELSRVTLLSEQQYTRAWLDGRARPKLILTPIRHVERLLELTDEDGEMKAFWYDAVELFNREGIQLEKCPNMALNHGTYRNHAHLHLKIDFTDDIWNTMVAPQYQEKIKELKQLLEQQTIVEDCFGKSYLEEKTRRQESRKKE
jgi:diadenosine tetraphosphate (Ap4A) HIT family hydrolase